MRKLASIASLFLVAALVVFVIQNLHTAKLQFFVWEASMSLAVPILGAYVLGGLTARSLFRLLNGQRKLRGTERKARKKAESDIKKEQHDGAHKQVLP